MIRFRSDRDQERQLHAIRSVADLFDGEPFIRGGMVFKSGTMALSAVVLTDEPAANLAVQCQRKTI